MNKFSIAKVDGLARPSEIDSRWKSLAQLNLEFQVRGRISESRGHRFLESDLMFQPKWNEVRMLAASLGEAVERLFLLDENTLEIRLRHVELENGYVQPQVHLCAVADIQDEEEKLATVLGNFCTRLTMVADLYDSRLDTALRPEEEEIVCAGVDDFLRATGGKPVSTGVQLVVDEKPIAKIAGIWRGSREVEPELSSEKQFEGLYDGRQLRTRTLFVFVTSPRPRTLEVFYDEQQFDEQLRKLGDDKNAMLSLILTETINQKKSVRFELVSFTRIEPPELLQLT